MDERLKEAKITIVVLTNALWTKDAINLDQRARILNRIATDQPVENTASDINDILSEKGPEQ